MSWGWMGRLGIHTCGLLLGGAGGLEPACASATDGWDADATSAAALYRQETWTTERGLPHNSVQAVVQTREGGLWVGTTSGLGYWRDGELRTYGPDDGLLDDWITGLHEDAEGGLWVSTGWGVHRFDARQQRFELVWDRDLRPAKLPAALSGDGAGGWWRFEVALGDPERSRPARLLRHRGAETAQYPMPVGPELVGAPNFLVADRQGYLWCSAGRHGVYRFRDGVSGFIPRPTACRTTGCGLFASIGRATCGSGPNQVGSVAGCHGGWARSACATVWGMRTRGPCARRPTVGYGSGPMAA
ncbi:MAG: hypothetical protein FJ387_25185 [Verrucomicrobia bacterium]|nr:hypothetical protein [Verrucomicrobiota bacterium]